MTSLLVAVAVAVAAAGALAVAARTPRLAALGLLVVLAGSPLLIEPGAPLPVLARLTGAVLAAYLMWVALREVPPARGTVVGWPTELLAATTAFVGGWLLTGTIASLSIDPGSLVTGPSFAVRAAGGAAAALGLLALTPVLLARDALRLGIGLLLALSAVDIARRAAGLAGSDLLEVSIAVAVAAVGAAVAWMCARTVESGEPFVLTGGPRRGRR